MEKTRLTALRYYHKKCAEMKMAELIVAETELYLAMIKVKSLKAELKKAEAIVKTDESQKSL